MELIVMLRSLRGAQWWWQAIGPKAMGEKDDAELATHGSVEVAIKARQRAENILVPFFKQYKDWWYIRPTRGQTDQFNSDISQNAQDAPIITGYLAGRSVVLLSCYWAQDVNETSDMLCWYDDGHHQSPAYRIQHDGRDTFFDRWELPKHITNPQPQYLRFQYTDINGTQHTLSGDYSFQVVGNPKPPAPFQSAP